jgi:hypothetical protein
VTLTDTLAEFYLAGRAYFGSSGTTLMDTGIIEIDYFDVR